MNYRILSRVYGPYGAPSAVVESPAWPYDSALRTLEAVKAYDRECHTEGAVFVPVERWLVPA